MKSMPAFLSFLSIAIAFCLASPAIAQWVEDGTAVCVLPSNQQYCQIVSDGEGGAIITWDDDRNGGGYDDIYAQRIDAFGNVLWDANGVAVCVYTGIQIYPKLVSDGAGGAIICWLDSRDGNYSIYAQRIDASGDTLWNGSGVALESTITGSCWYNDITTDNAGGAIVVWTDMRTGAEQVFAQRVSAGGDTLWNGEGVRVCSTANTQSDPKVTTDCSHGCFVSWYDARGTSWDVYAQRIKPDGKIVWGSGYPVCTYTERQSGAVITTDKRGGAVIAWEDYRSGSHYDVYAGRIDTTGAYSWAQIVCDEADDQNWIDIEPSVNGGVIIAWTDERTGAADVYAQGVDRFGNMLWTADGVGVCTYAGYQAQVQIAPDGGGAVFVFYDYRAGDGNIYCQKIDAGGNLLWDADGVVICDVSGTQSIPMITPDGAGGAIMCWNDQRNSWNDIFAQRVECNGYWGYPSAPIVDITDVPGDQGGRVTVRWNGTRLDEYPNQVVTHYSVWRSITGPEAALLLAAGVPEFAAPQIAPDFEGPAYRRTTLGGASYWWEWVANMDAHYLDNYALTSPTLYDSTGAGTGYHHFFISAHTSDPFNFWDSQPDSGYSVDNLAPCMPASLAGEQSFSPEGLDITWDPNTEIDLGAYAVYRGLTEDFVPGPGSMLASDCDTFYFDGDWRWDSGYFYKVSAIDIHGNESPFALLRPTDVTGVETPETPLAYFLDQNVPNPFNPVTAIRFGLEEPGHVSLRIFDAAGRLVRVLVDEQRPGGRYEETWNGVDLHGNAAASGVYFYRLSAGTFTGTRKMVLLR